MRDPLANNCLRLVIDTLQESSCYREVSAHRGSFYRLVASLCCKRRHLLYLKKLVRCERQQKISCGMEAGSLKIFLCALFVFSAKGALKFTRTPENSFLALEGDNITLEWRYTFVDGESFLSASFRMGRRKVVDKYNGNRDSKPIIQRAYRGRLHANMTNDYTSITLLAVNRLDKGSYTIEIISLPYVDANTSEVDISVLYLDQPNITSTDTRPVEGTAVTFYCNSSGEPQPTTSWTMNGYPLNTNSNSGILFTDDKKHLTIVNVSRTDSGEYQCVTNNSLGNISSNASILRVQHKPKINPLLQMIHGTEGGEVIIFCNATGNPAPRISWTRNGHSVDTSNSSRMDLSHEGRQLSIKNVSKTDSAVYRCVVENSVENVTSYGTTLEVHYIPGVTMIGGPQQFAIVGKIKKLVCEYDALPPVSEVQWIKDGDVIARNFSLLVNESHLTVSHYNESEIQLLINQSTSRDAGDYTCLVINAVGNSSQKTSIISQELPLMTIHPEGKTPMEGENMTLSCNATGNPEPSISWVKDGFPINSNSRISFSHDKQRLTITNVSRMDSGEYRCVARNRVGNNTSNSKVNVLFRAEIVSHRQVNVTKEERSNLTLFCNATGNPAPIIFWTKDGSSLSNSSRIRFSKHNRLLTISNLNRKDSGHYRCVANNSLGNDTSNVTTVDIQFVPDPPQNITVDTKGSRVVNISWTAGFDGNSAIEKYTIEIRELDQIFKDVVCQGSLSSSACVVSSLSTTASLTGLFPWTSYNIRVFARNKIGRSNSSPILNVTTDEAEPSRGAENVSSREVNYTTNKITWAGLPKEAANGVIKLYEIRLELKESCLKVDFTFHAMNTTKSSVLLAGFWMCAKYEVSVRGYTVAGPGPYSKAIVVQTKSLKLSHTWSKETPSAPSFSQIPRGEGITANITLPRFPGNAKFFQVIVIRYSLDYTGVVNSPESFTPKDLMTYEEAHKSPVPAAYVTFQLRGQDFDAFQEFVVGDGGHSSSKTRNSRGSDGEVFLNKPLHPNTNYRVFLRAFIEKMVYFSSNFVTIEIKGKPAVKDLPERTIFKVGDVVVLTCEATGDPKPSVTWSKDGNTSIPRAQFRNDDHILVIQEVALGDGGIYECRASNIFGQRRTATVVVIAVPPSIMKDVSPRSVICAKETPCSLLCHATSDILFNYSWTRNGQALGGHNIKVMNNSVIITPLDDEDFGDYVCHATNSFGSTTYKITLSESKEEENNVRSIFRANDIIWSVIVFPLLVLIGVLIWRLRRAQASNRPATAKKATSRDTVKSVFPLEQHASEPGSYMELRPRPSEGQTRVPPEYQSSQGSHVNAGYYNVVPEEGNKRGSNDEIYDDIVFSDC